jgi:hypothetical protein
MGGSENKNVDICSNVKKIMQQVNNSGKNQNISMEIVENIANCNKIKNKQNITQNKKTEQVEFAGVNAVRMCSILGRKYIPTIINSQYKWDDNLTKNDYIFSKKPFEIKEYIAKYEGSRVLTTKNEQNYKRINYVCSFNIKENKIIDITIKN